MTFKESVRATKQLTNAYRRGLQALRESDRNRLSCATPRRLRGSIDLDSHLAATQLQATRWDYGIGLRHDDTKDRVIWLEVHPASSGHVSEILDKLRWLRDWLRDSAPRLNALPREFVWVSSGPVHLQQGSRQARILASNGMRHPVSHLRI